MDFDFDPLISDVKNNLPPTSPLKKLYSVNKGCAKSEYISKYFLSKFAFPHCYI